MVSRFARGRPSGESSLEPVSVLAIAAASLTGIQAKPLPSYGQVPFCFTETPAACAEQALA